MKSKICVAFMVLLLMALSGCNNAPQQEDEPQHSSVSESSQHTSDSELSAEHEENEVETTPKPIQREKTEKQEKTTNRKKVSSEQPQTVSDDRQPADLPKQADKTENPVSRPQPSVPDEETCKETEPQETEEMPSETKPDFDIGHWISFAKEYALSVGLELDSEAIYCWDNPLGAGAHSKYLERDITDCLNRYAKDEDISAVWIWAEEVGNNSFELYIGYA